MSNKTVVRILFTNEHRLGDMHGHQYVSVDNFGYFKVSRNRTQHVCFMLLQTVYVFQILYQPKVGTAMQSIIRLLQFNLFARRDLLSLIKGDPPDPDPPNLQNQLVFS